MFVIPARAAAAVALNVTFTVVATLIVLLRLGTRAVLVKNVGVDDYLIVGALISSITFLAIFMIQIQNGLGRDLSFQDLPGFLEALWATIPVYSLTLYLCKVSITIQYCRVFTTRGLRIYLRTLLAALVILGLWSVFGPIFTCWPIEAAWAVGEGVKATCMDKTATTYVNATFNIATDLIIVSTPLPLLKKLQIPKRQKYILLGVFSVGLFATIISIVRLHALYEIAQAPLSQDSIEGVDIALWSCIEINTAIMCASAPALKAFVAKVFPKIISDITGTTRLRTRNADASHATHTRKNGSGSIQVQRSITMESVPSAELAEPTPDDWSEKNPYSTLKVDCYAIPDAETARRKGSDGRGSPV